MYSLVSIYFALNDRTVREFAVGSLERRIFSIPVVAEQQFFDARSKFIYNHKKQDKDLVMLLIDDESLVQLGRWPWTRTDWETLRETEKET